MIGLLTGIYSGENITNDLEEYLNSYALVRPVADGLSVTIVLLVTTFFTVILGELVPERIGLANPEAISIRIAPVMKALSIFASPFVWIFTRTSDVFFRLFKLNASADVNVTEEEIKEVIQEATTTGQMRLPTFLHQAFGRLLRTGPSKREESDCGVPEKPLRV